MLPSFLLPHKHYTEETISGVLDEVVKPTDEDSEEHPSERTMIRWHHWLMVNEFTIDGLMKSIAFRDVSNLPIFERFCHPIFAHKSTKKAAEASSWVGMSKMV